MKKLLLLFFITAALVSCGKDQSESDCASMVCDASFSTLTFSFTDKDGNGVSVKNYSAVNQRTGDTVKASSAIYVDLSPGFFLVVDDAYKSKLSAKGDDIKISGTYEATGQTKTATIKVSGGDCKCHIEKLSGPDKIVFD